MSKEELRRASVLARVQAGDLSQADAAGMLGLSYRQTKRLYGRYRKGGAKAVAHGNAGRRSHHAKDPRLRRRVLALVRKQYGGDADTRFGPTLAAEHLREDHAIAIDAETLRRWMLSEGLWSRERKSRTYRQRRSRRAHFGELVQMDGSFEKWLEDRAGRACLINMVDDATSLGLALLAGEETTWAVADALRSWVETYGIPRALYVDWKNVYHTAPKPGQQAGAEPISQFQRMCGKLGIQLIGAHSPQAKGRVERSHGVHQDRLIKKMRLKQIGGYEEANQYLKQIYLPQHNARYAVAPAERLDFHEPVPRGLNLEDVFCLETERKVSNDWVVQYGSRWLQIEPQARVAAGSRVLIRQRRDGSLKLVQQQAEVAWHELPARPRQPPPSKPTTRARHKPRPAPDHPWRRLAVALGAH
jgi:transposase